MVTGAARRQEPLRGLRPFNPTRDLNQVADLLRLTFQEELGRSEAAWLQDMESLGSLKPITWLLNQLNIVLGSLFYGFVWIENGRIIGNVTISRMSSANWLISNVAVDPHYRRRGIARQLMDASVDWICGRGARRAILEVRRDNMPAKSLYLDMGFVIVNGTTEMERYDAGLVTHVAAPEGYRLRSARPTDGPAMYELARDITPELAQRIEPLRQRDYEISNLDRLVDGLRRLIGLPRTLRWVVTDATERMVAALKISVGGRSHRLHLLIHPDVHGKLEEALVSRAVDALSLERGIVRTKVDADHMELIVTLEAHGFREVRTLDRMALELAQ